MNTGKKLKKDTNKNASNITTEEVSEINGGRTVILRDNLGELVLSSTYEEDTIPNLLNLAHQQKMRQVGLPPINIPPGPRSYHG
jgi:hypothetical protein